MLAQAGCAAALEAVLNLRDWLADTIYSLSAEGPIAHEFEGVDLMNLSVEPTRAVLRSAMTLPLSGDITNMLASNGRKLSWLAEEDLDYLVTEFEYSGLVAPLNIYKNFALNWEGLSQYNDRTFDIPSLFIGGDRDIKRDLETGSHSAGTRETHRHEGKHHHSRLRTLGAAGTTRGRQQCTPRLPRCAMTV